MGPLPIRSRCRPYRLCEPPGDASAGCNTSTFPVGTDSIVAVYSGDDSFQPSTSAPLSVSAATTADHHDHVAAGTAAAQRRPSPRRFGTHDPRAPRSSDVSRDRALSRRSGSLPCLPRRLRQPTNSLALRTRRPRRPRRGLTVRRPSSSSIRRGTRRSTAPSSSRSTPPAPSPWSPGPAETWTPTWPAATTTPSYHGRSEGDGRHRHPATPPVVPGPRLVPRRFEQVPRQSRRRRLRAGLSRHRPPVQIGRCRTMLRSCGPSTPTTARPLRGSRSTRRSFVDWIAADGYDRSTSPPTVGLVQNRFRPLVLGVLLLRQAAHDLGHGCAHRPGSLGAAHLPEPARVGAADDLPLVKAVVYQDGPSPGPTGTPYNYTLDQAGQPPSIPCPPAPTSSRTDRHDHVGLGLGRLAPRARSSPSPPPWPVRIWVGACRSWTTVPPSPAVVTYR